MAKFYKVSFEQFKNACRSLESAGSLRRSSDEEIKEYYDEIQLPQRATDGSAGYDFYIPFGASFSPAVHRMIPSGVGVRLDHGTFLMCVPRSGLGFKYGMQLRNSVGVIDEDYSSADNEGHIMAKITTEAPFMLHKGDRFMQGIIVPYFTVENDEPITSKRTGGFGSTGGN